MSKCMTFDETIDQKDIFSEVTPKGIVDSVLEEILVSVLTVSDKGCNRIGDFNINEDFCQQYNQPLHVKDFEQANINQTSSAGNLYTGKNREHPGNNNENSGADWLGKTEENIKLVSECKVISQDVLADNELQIQNGQIHLEKVKRSLESAREEYYQKEDVIKDEKIEIEYYNQGKLNKIYVPLNEPSKEPNPQLQNDPTCEDANKKESEKENYKNENESPFKPFTTEGLRQVWSNGNSSLVGKWDGDMAGQREEVVKLMEGLSSIPDVSADPNRPRTCSVAEEDVRKMIKEIEEISFIQSHDTMEDYPPDGQGDADLESKSFTKSKDILNKSRTESQLFPENSNDDLKKSQEEEVHSTEMKHEPSPDSIANIGKTIWLWQTNKNDIQEDRFGENVPTKERTVELNLQGEGGVTAKLSGTETYIADVPLENAACMEDLKGTIAFSATGSVDVLEFQDRIYEVKAEVVNSRSISGNDVFSEFMVPSETGTAPFTSELGITHIATDRSVSIKHLSSEENKLQNTHSRSGEVTESQTPVLEDVNAENVEGDEKCPSGYMLTETLSQGGNSCSQTHKPSAESVNQSMESGSIHSQESLTNPETQSEVEPGRSESGKFKLHSEKMYLRMGYDPAGFQKKKSVLSRSEETFIESTESVLQIIEPEENSQDVASGSVSFSLLSQESNNSFEKPSAPSEVDSKPDVDANNEVPLSDGNSPKKVYSGMTTIGPMKNTDHDPKDLTAPDIDFGKMTHITSSRQLAKDLNLLGADLTSTTAVKILEEDDSDDSIMASDNDCLETSSLVNRDIASLTKVQKIREVMSYQPKPEEDFEDEEALPKPRLDLKDMESMTDERYKVPEVSIPLLSFEVTSETIGTDVEAEKQLIESMGLLISGFTEPYYADIEENNEESENDALVTESLEESPQNGETKNEEQSLNDLEEDNSDKDIDIPFDRSEAAGENKSKYGTLSGVLKKASSKFMKKESDVLLRNSKSLPRDTSKIITTESIRSILDDCSTSASNVLKKSRSMLRNTQSLFKTISQNRMSNDNGLEKHKMSPSESDVSTVERKLSFLKTEDFAKAKNIIKSKMEKTFKRQETSSEMDTEQPEISEDKKGLQVVIRNEEKLRVDRMENFKKWLPKSPLVYKSQFVKSQIKMKDKSPGPDTNSKEEENGDRNEPITAGDEEAATVQEIAKEIETIVQEEQTEETQEFAMEDDLDMMKEETQPDYIVMETVQGLPISDLESPSSEKENVETNVTSREYGKGSDHQVNKLETQVMKEKELDIAPEHMQTQEDKVASKMSSERKMMAKKKKFSARLRNFWCSAFGRVKTPPKKSDIS